jgi:hypothetical protein
MPEPILMKLDMYEYIMAPEASSTAYKSLLHISVSVCVSPIVARQRLGKNFTAETDAQAAVEELFFPEFFLLLEQSIKRK